MLGGLSKASFIKLKRRLLQRDKGIRLQQREQVVRHIVFEQGEEVRAKKGQIIIEYAVMFTVIVAVIIYASTVFIKPALNRFFNTTAKVIDNATNRVENNF